MVYDDIDDDAEGEDEHIQDQYDLAIVTQTKKYIIYQILFIIYYITIYYSILYYMLVFLNGFRNTGLYF